MMKAEIKGFHSPDIRNLEVFIPDDEDNFGFLLQAFVGPKGEDWKESFDFEVCTPKFLLCKYKQEDILFGRHKVIVFEYNYHRIINHIEKLVGRYEGQDWNDLANKIARYGYWEFEDYRE